MPKVLKFLLHPKALPGRPIGVKEALSVEPSAHLIAVREVLAARLEAMNRELLNVSKLYDRPDPGTYVAGLLMTRKELTQLYEQLTEYTEINIDDME